MNILNFLEKKAKYMSLINNIIEENNKLYKLNLEMSDQNKYLTNENKELDFIYSDEDKLNLVGNTTDKDLTDYINNILGNSNIDCRKYVFL